MEAILAAPGPWLLLGAIAVMLGASWIGLRRSVGARVLGQAPRLLVLDMLPILAFWAWLLALSARPASAAALTLALSLALLFGNRAKIAALGEPLVFSDIALLSVVTHPPLYAQVMSPTRMWAPALALLAVTAGLCLMEPPQWPVAYSALPAVAVAVVACCPWLRRRLGVRLRWPVPEPHSTDPVRNLAALGPIAGTLAQAATAASEREGRRRGTAPGLSGRLRLAARADGPVVMLQLESFFDARRLGGHVPQDLLPEFDRCLHSACVQGRLNTPAYGANTVRTEFAALTGLSERDLGFDRYNPYAAFARLPVDSIAWRLREQGFRTVCLHPFAGAFYGRHRVMPNLGFDAFIDIGGFGADAPAAGYVPDVALVRRITDILDSHGPNVFVFGISMDNHSPWGPAVDASGGVDGFLAGLARADEAVGAMAEQLRARWEGSTLAVFGDHQPHLPALAPAGAARDVATDYFVWRPEGAQPVARDIDANMLPRLVLDHAVRTRRAGHAQPRAASVPARWV